MRIKDKIEKEMKDSEILLDKLSDPKIKTRTEKNLQWFVEKAVKNKIYYYTLSIISFLGPITINIAMVFSTERVEIRLLFAIASGVDAFASYLLQLFDVRKKWGIYRNQAEMIKSGLSLYGLSGHDNPKEFVEKMEADIAQTNGKWMSFLGNDI